MSKKPFYKTLLALVLFFSLFLFISDTYIYKQQRNTLLENFSQSQQTELKLLSQLAKESLISNNYALIEWFLKRWAEERTTVVKITLKSDNGFAIVEYQRPKISKTKIISSSTRIVLHNEVYTLKISSETTEINLSLDKLQQQLFLLSVIASLVLVISTWYLFKYLSIRPLLHEIKLRQNAESEIKKQHQYLQTVINGVKDGLMVIDKNYKVQLYNDAINNLSNVNSTYCYQISHHRDTPCDGKHHPCPLQTVLDTKEHTSVLHNHPDKQGEDHFFELLASPLFDKKGEVAGIIESSREMTSHINLQNELEEKTQHFNHMAHHDPLTSLPNRLLFSDRLEQAQLKSKRTGKPFALFFIDLDQFKQINDSVGHNIGDAVLVQTAKNLQECIRADDTIARIGGDEFTIILSSFSHIDSVIAVANKVIHAVQKPMLIKGKEYHLTPSIGISLYPQDTESTEMLIRNADSAMFKVKEQGRNDFQFYTEKLTQQALKRLEIENGIHKALIEKNFIIWYQPQYDISSGQLVGMEALVRWEDPEKGIIPPSAFIPLAEESDLIIDLGRQIIDQTMKQVAKWHNDGFNLGRVAINLSARQLFIGDISANIKQLLEKNHCQVEWIELEVTESVIMSHSETAIKNLNKLHDMGFSIALDDFGTGYSSLAYLKHLPISKLKIDRSFIKDLPFDRDDIGIARAVIALAKGLNLSVIAEGVETEEQAKFLLKEGCALAQGFMYSKPIPPEDVTSLLTK